MAHGQIWDRRLWAGEEQGETLAVVPPARSKGEGEMVGWRLPEPSCMKSDDQLQREREDKGAELVRVGMLRSERLRWAMLTVRREDFVPAAYRDHSYEEVPVRLPGRHATISCPHIYPLFYEALGLEEGQRVLEVGLGSGYGAALAREVVGPRGLVVSLEIDPDTFAYAADRLDRAGYRDVVRVLADGGEGWPAQAPYDRICVTAACPQVPPPLLEQLRVGGRLIVPLERDSRQVLTLCEKAPDGLHRTEVCDVLYVPLQGAYGRERPRVGEAPPALVVTCAGGERGRHTRSVVRRALPHARIHGTAFRGVLRVHAAGDPRSLAEHVTRTCRGSVGRVTAVLAEVPSEREILVEAVVGTGVDQVAPGESFAFRVHKRGAHRYAEPTPELEYAVGGALWDALARRDGIPPRVNLTRPDVLVNAEVLGPTTLVGIVRRAWQDEQA